MKIYDQIISFPQQFLWKPEIEHGRITIPAKEERIVICGMGGSALAGNILRSWLKKDFIIHRDFHLPDKKIEFVIVVSYSGNTEETLTAFEKALKKRIPMATIASGGKLEELSHSHKIPFIRLPQGFEPRQTIGFMLKALASILAPAHMNELETIALLNPLTSKIKGLKLGRKIFGKIPLIYSSKRLAPLAYNWKIRFNETGKIPAFMGIVPELFHNEISGFDTGSKLRNILDKFIIMLFTDTADLPEIKKRFHVFKQILVKKNLTVVQLPLRGKTFLEAFMHSIILADWTSYFLALEANANPEEALWVEEFKRLVKK